MQIAQQRLDEAALLLDHVEARASQALAAQLEAGEKALAAGRHATDQAQRVKAYQDIADRFAVDLPYIWLSVTLNQIAFKPNVHGFLDWKLPDGSPGYDYLLVSYQPGGFLAGHVWAG